MRRIPSSMLGVDQGEVSLFSHFDTGGEMWTGSGDREVRQAIRFSERYRQPPVVQVSVSLWDVDHGANFRAEIAAENVTVAGCDLVLRTWADSRHARIRMTWLALGMLDSEDDWLL